MANKQSKSKSKSGRRSRGPIMDDAALTHEPTRRKSAELRAQDSWNRRVVKPLVCKTDAQREYLRNIETKQITIGVGPAGTGKAQPLTSLIRTPTGWSSMGDMEVGFIVSTPDGTTGTVTAVYPQGEKDIYKLTFEDGRCVECCGEHLWEIYRHDWSPEDSRWRVIDTFKIIDLLNTPSAQDRLYVRLTKEVVGNNIVPLLNPYLVGAILGDGHVSDSAVHFSTADVQMVATINGILPEGYVLRHRKTYDYTIVRDEGRTNGPISNPILTAFREFAIAGLTSREKFIPDVYLGASVEQRFALLQGLFDTDGTVDKCGSVSYSTTSFVLARQVQYLVRSLGGLAKVKNKRTTFGEHECLSYTVNIRIPNPKRLFTLERKIARLPEKGQYEDNLKLRIKSVEYVGKKPAQCIQIDHPDHLYLTDEFTVTHNTFVCTKHAAQMLDDRRIARIVVVRPIIEAGGGLGFLPGDEGEKTAPYQVPFLEVLEEHYGKAHLENMINGAHPSVIFVPPEFIRGRTFQNAYVILDEAQNMTCDQMKTFLTRLGEDTSCVINGDTEQVDIGERSGLLDALEILDGLGKVGITTFTEEDVVRSGICKEILMRYRARKILMAQQIK